MIDLCIRLLYSTVKVYLLIDSGVSLSAESIFSYIKENVREVEGIMTLILTHAHPDHIGAAKIIKDETECFVFAHEGAKAWVEDIDLQHSQRLVPGFSVLVSGAVKVNELLKNNQIIEPESGMIPGTVRIYTRPWMQA